MFNTIILFKEFVHQNDNITNYIIIKYQHSLQYNTFAIKISAYLSIQSVRNLRLKVAILYFCSLYGKIKYLIK